MGFVWLLKCIVWTKTEIQECVYAFLLHHKVNELWWTKGSTELNMAANICAVGYICSCLLLVVIVSLVLTFRNWIARLGTNKVVWLVNLNISEHKTSPYELFFYLYIPEEFGIKYFLNIMQDGWQVLQGSDLTRHITQESSNITVKKAWKSGKGVIKWW